MPFFSVCDFVSSGDDKQINLPFGNGEELRRLEEAVTFIDTVLPRLDKPIEKSMLTHLELFLIAQYAPEIKKYI